VLLFFFASRRRHTRSKRDWSSDVCSSDLPRPGCAHRHRHTHLRPGPGLVGPANPTSTRREGLTMGSLSDRPFPTDTPESTETNTAGSKGIGDVPQRVLIWRHFRRNKLAVFGALVLCLLLLVSLFAEFLAPSTPQAYDAARTHAPPQRVHFVDTSDGFELGMYVYD